MTPQNVLTALLTLLALVNGFLYLRERKRAYRAAQDAYYARGELVVHEVRAEVERGRG